MATARICKHSAGHLVGALLLAVCGYAGAGGPAPPFRAPYLPAGEGDVLQSVAPASDPKVQAMRERRRRLDADRRNLAAAIRLADAYVDYGRQVGDAHYAGYAEAVIAPWLSSSSPPAEILVIDAEILQYRHEFDAARARLKEALARDGQNGQAWLTLATLDTVQGDYPSASRGCARAAASAGYAYGAACAAALRANLGQAEQSARMLELIAAQSLNAAPAFRAWIAGLSAETAQRLGNWEAAERHYREALSYTPSDNFLQVAYADLLLDRQRPAEVLKLLGTDNASDTAFLRIALAQAALKSPDSAGDVWIMTARFAALQQRGSDFFGREQARFALRLQHDPQTALQLALQNWQQQREPADTRVLLEAALAAKQPAAAATALAFVERNRLQDPIITTLAQQLRAASGAGATP